jgi:hypothetical protein
MMPYLGDTVTWLSNQHIDPDTPAGLCKALGIGADICLIGAKKLDCCVLRVGLARQTNSRLSRARTCT